MPKFSADLSCLFSEFPFEDRFKAAAAAGFKGVDLPFPDIPMGRLGDLLSVNGLTPTLIDSLSGDDACQGARESAFRTDFQKLLEHADLLECRQVHVQCGVASERERKAAYKSLLGNLRYAAREARAWNIKVLVGFVNGFDMPDSFLDNPALMLEIMDEVDDNNLFILLDLYHAQRSRGGLSDFIETNIARIAHIRIAGAPGRYEPNVGEVHYPFLFDLLDAHGYNGWIGCHYHPQVDTLKGLKWARSWDLG